jgi:hypothetical protein
MGCAGSKRTGVKERGTAANGTTKGLREHLAEIKATKAESAGEELEEAAAAGGGREAGGDGRGAGGSTGGGGGPKPEVVVRSE